MTVCLACSTENPNEAKFCFMCGRELPPHAGRASVHIKPEEIDPLLNDGYRLLHENRVDEALFLADAILEVDPDCTSGLALKGMCHEHRGELDEAIDVYERVVALNPESTLDRIKLAQLRRKADAGPPPEELEVRSRNWVAILSGIAASLVVVALGVMLALSGGSEQPGEAPPEDTVAANTEGFAVVESPTPSADVPVPDASANPALTPPPLVPPASGPVSASTPPVADASGPWIPGGSVLTPDTGGSFGGLPPAGSSEVMSPSPPSSSSDDDVRDVPPPRQPRIEISEHRPPTESGSDSSAESANIYRVARNKMAAGDYRGAIRDFQAALRGASNPAQIHQFLGQCYKAIGNASAARNHYQQAADLFEKSGQPAAAEACRQAIRTLG